MPTVDKVSEYSKIECIIVIGMGGGGVRWFLSLPDHAGGNTIPLALLMLCFPSAVAPMRLCRQCATCGFLFLSNTRRR